MKKDILITKLKESCSTILKLLEGIDLEIIVYEDSGWRIKDILGHIATWDNEVRKSIEAFNAGNEYAIQELDENNFNHEAFISLRELNSVQITTKFVKTRQEFIKSIIDFDQELLENDFLFPWGDESGSLTKLVEYMIEHDDEHKDEILNAIQVMKA